MPWQGDSKVLIDRFDGRAHLDFIAEKRSAEDENYDADLSPSALAQVNYERYRILVQNDFLNSEYLSLF
jgi:arginine/serine-rich splicing factor 16